MTPLVIIRKQRMLTVRDLAARAGVTPATVNYIEVGRTQEPTMKVIRAICTALEVQPGQVDEFRRALGLPEIDELGAAA
jgi:DNA-binding Xre family transcriptional regulator